MSDQKANLTAAEREARMLESIDEVMVKSAKDSEILKNEEPQESEPDRLEDRSDPDTGDELDVDEEFEARTSSSASWGYSPSIKDQLKRYPDTVRMVEPEAMLFDLRDPEQLKAYNGLLRESSNPDAATRSISEIDKQSIPGMWVVTSYRIQYQQLI